MHFLPAINSDLSVLWWYNKRR